ncbi:MAG: ATP-binding protein [Deltaproteobacteria bacterium]|nr:ATP-binding protein [Deltaproteobacteria bacterium]
MERYCRCTPLQVRQYRSKISGPLMDRIDIQMEVPGVRFKDLTDSGDARSSREIYRCELETQDSLGSNRKLDNLLRSSYIGNNKLPQG